MTDPVAVEALRAVIEQWRAKGAAIDRFHATMGVGWKACADDLDALLSAVRQPQVQETKDDTETRVVDTQYAAPLATAGENEVVPTDAQERDRYWRSMVYLDPFIQGRTWKSAYKVAQHDLEAANRQRDELLTALTDVARMIAVGWIPPDDLDDYKPEGIWEKACEAFRDSSAYNTARDVIDRALRGDREAGCST